MIIDAFTYNNERELLELRLNILDSYVDEFVILEANQTFSGKEKPLYFEKDKDLFKKWAHKIKYYVLNDWNDEKIWEMAKNSPNTEYGKGAKHWLQEFYIKEHLQKALAHLKDEDKVFIGDCDEVWMPECIGLLKESAKLKLKVYTYFLNNRSDEQFWGTIFAPYKDIKHKCLNHLRTNLPKTAYDLGWHFTSLAKDLRKKLTDSYTEESYATPQVLNNLETNINDNTDFLGRQFHYNDDESEHPEYLKRYKQKYLHLFK